ncbi:MAG: orotidine-5'-phosphate decarboxylase [Sulfurospirillaceae bacterium]|nr:orotidine-5'-phosphate decarboxylase [Sulfurospirillaceae bacterium]MCK9546248.1 orotidine-5'-phosphate decarboxylase [Sulfurospirillaceae bacterium]MDY0238174.1 orotidine-5'-phosphate decarboxylase [Campylobacterales bacterium]NLM99309.1 orotidine-5'-phosphate decarboxylase [Campylobacteraceae bacterium]
MKLCVALDLPSLEENIALANELKGLDIWLKVGLRAYIKGGGEFVKSLQKISSEFKIFLDLKLYDIPNTMADAAQSIGELGIDMFNVHASAGKEAMEAVMDRVGEMKAKPLVLAVTALTSFDEDGFRKIYNSSIESKAAQFAKDAYESKLNGVVCSVYESSLIKRQTSSSFLTLTPGIRPFESPKDDQKRVANLKDAKKEKSDFLVIGRPIYRALNPREITKKVLDEMRNME